MSRSLAHHLLLLAVTACGTAKMDGTDCPHADQLVAGSTVNCGGRTISGTLLRSDLPECTATSQVGCVATTATPAADAARLTSDNVRLDAEVGGITGTLAPVVISGGYSLCASDGMSACIVTGSLTAVNTTDLAPKIVAGQVAGGVTGTGVPTTADACFGNAQVGCLTTTDYPASDQETLLRCLPH